MLEVLNGIWSLVLGVAKIGKWNEEAPVEPAPRRLTAGEKRWYRLVAPVVNACQQEQDSVEQRNERHDEAVRYLRCLSAQFSQQAKEEKQQRLLQHAAAWRCRKHRYPTDGATPSGRRWGQTSSKLAHHPWSKAAKRRELERSQRLLAQRDLVQRRIGWRSRTHAEIGRLLLRVPTRIRFRQDGEAREQNPPTSGIERISRIGC